MRQDLAAGHVLVEPGEAAAQAFVDREIEKRVDRMAAALAREVGDAAPLVPVVALLRDLDDALLVPGLERAAPALVHVAAQPGAAQRIGEPRQALLARA